MEINGHAAVVTGGASGLGAATARRLAALGAKVGILDRDAARAEAVAAEIGGIAAPCDVADSDGVAAALEHVRGRHAAQNDRARRPDAAR
jgi:NAD(P)-dependent dehydrogenase (short-subunit alcohol dehydrogenase family)